MTTEARLRNALHEFADPIEPSTDSWARIEARFDEGRVDAARPPRRSVRTLVLAGLALALVLLLVTVLVFNDQEPGSRVVTQPADTAMPRRILAITSAGHPVVLDSITGQRVNGYEAGIAEGTQIAVTPDGQDAYLVTGDGNEGCAEHSILRLPVGSGARGGEQVATEATSPTVSPDGLHLAYLRCLPGDARADEIVLLDLASGGEQTTRAPAGTFFINRLEFAADSRRVLFDLFDDAAGRSTLHEIDVVAGAAPPGRDVGVAVGSTGWVGVRGETGEYLGVLGDGSGTAVVGMRGPSPFSLTSLRFNLPTAPTQVVSDRSGLHILAVADHALYRWSDGDKEPTKLLGNYIGVAWIPDAPSAEPVPPTPSARPHSLVVAADGRLAVLRSADGSASLAVPGELTGVTSLAVTPDGRSAVVPSGPKDCRTEVGLAGDLSTQPEIDRVPLGTGARTRVVGGSDFPAVSAKGLVAYGYLCDGQGLGFTDLTTGQNFRSDALGGTGSETAPTIAAVRPLAWSGDSRALLYEVDLRGDDRTHYYLGQLWPAVPEREHSTRSIGDGLDATAAALVEEGTVAFAQDFPGGSRVRDWDTAAGGFIRGDRGFQLPETITSLVADPSGTHFLAITGSHALYRWSVGDAAPTKLADGVTAAAWLP